MKLFSILSTTTMALLLAAGCSSTTTNQTDGGTETGTATDTGTGGADTGGGTADTGTATTDSGSVPCSQCTTVVCATEKAACESDAPCVSQYNTWGMCVQSCEKPETGTQTECINVCNGKLTNAKATDLATCVLQCSQTCTQ